ncbi:uncharacterized protein C8A04DRAFT_9500 [Dichotomopilus funicola]|uniref:Uncharacterized protein n=1 Tax=Dichotomopilus funicola TaxID=1934379 RepID=A0AAN6ZQY4_9PEZI|nr:hypothetical protein C8A04DRAFT_9500 [Dichotomopilus funicola]
MRLTGHGVDDSWTSFGQRRGIPGATLSGLDITRARIDCGGVADPGSYPSPPMSGSPPLPAKTSHGVAERSEGAHQTTTRDVYRGIPTTRSDERAHAGAAGEPPLFLSEASERGSYAFPRSDGPGTRSLPYPPALGQATSQPTAYMSGPETGATAHNQPGSLPPQAYPPTGHHGIGDAVQSTTPKPQRKAKGHVASACVPCKKAHLRTNKEGACVDVQHKKRGRPRLRDDSQTKYEGARFGSTVDSMRRPLSSSYGPGPPPPGMVYDDPLRRIQSYRVLKSQPAEATAPRFPERGLVSDTNVFSTPLSIATARTPEEPVAYLTIGLEFSKASSSFLSGVGRTSVAGLEFTHVLTPEERPRATRLQQQAQEEQTRKDPAYLPPIFSDRTDAVIQSLGFSPEEVARHPLPWLDTFAFLGDDGQVRQVSVRAGLASQNSIYFVVLLLSRVSRSSYPTPSPSLREMSGSFEVGLQSYSQPTPLSATFDSRQPRLSDSGYDSRQPGPPPSGPLNMLPTRSPGLSSSTYGVSPNRPEYPITPRTYQTPRTDVHAAARPSQAADYQILPLPRIRSPPVSASQHPEPLQGQPQLPSLPPPPPYQPREETSRMGIGGLLEHPGTTRSA